MEKGKYLKFKRKGYPTFKFGKLYKVVNEDKFDKIGHCFVVQGEQGQLHYFSKNDVGLKNVYYKNYFELYNIKHSIDDLLDKYNMYKKLSEMFGEKKYKRVMNYIIKCLEYYSSKKEKVKA